MGVLSRLTGALRGAGKRVQQAAQEFFGGFRPSEKKEEKPEERKPTFRERRRERRDTAQTNLAKGYLRQKTGEVKPTTRTKGEVEKTTLEKATRGNAFYAATKELWVHDVPRKTTANGVSVIDTKKIDEVIMRKLGVTNMYDAVAKLEEQMGINPFTSDEVVKDFERYDTVKTKGQLAVLEIKKEKRSRRR